MGMIQMKQFVKNIQDSKPIKVPDPFSRGVQCATNGGAFFDCPFSSRRNKYEFDQWLRGFNFVRHRQVTDILRQQNGVKVHF